ncbi:MAG: hypothetical protein U9N52_07850 [Campylobacterota bacterium]|nr:hypothetical protein [Campylobacterota bacterium]
MKTIITSISATVIVLAIGVANIYAEEAYASFLPSDTVELEESKSGGWNPLEFEQQPIQIPDSNLDVFRPKVPENISEVVASDATFDDRILISWIAPSGASYYKIGLTLWGSIKWLDASYDSTFYTFESDPSKIYTFSVQACNALGCSDIVTDKGSTSSAESPLEPVPELPDRPSNVSASDGTYPDKILITWSSADGATYYKVGLDTVGGFQQIPGADALVATRYTYFTDNTDRLPFMVAACNDVGCAVSNNNHGSIASPEPIEPEPIEPEAAVLLSPTDLRATDGTYADKVEITFNAAAGAASYWVFRSDELFGMGYRSITRTSSTSFIDTTAIPGVQYYYAATSCDADGVCTEDITPDGGYAGVLGEGVVEEEDEVVDEILAPAVPDRITTSRGVYEDKVEIAISEVENATQYEIYRTTDAASMGSKIGTTSETITNDNTVTPGINYFYRVKACNDAGCSDFTMADRGFAQASEAEPDHAVVELEETVAGLLISQESYMIGGSFGRHDFAGVERAFDWAFTTPRGSSFQLQGVPATSGDVFGWAEADIPTPTPAWYMFPLNVDMDDDGSMMFDWILASADMNNKMVVKLSGVSRTGEFLYSHQIDVDYSVSDGEIFFTAP